MEETPMQIIKDRQIVKVIQNVWLSITLIGLLPLHPVVSLAISCSPHELQWKDVIGFSFIADVHLPSWQGCSSSLFGRPHPTNPNSWYCHLRQLIFSVWVEFFFFFSQVFHSQHYIMTPLFSALEKRNLNYFSSYAFKVKHNLT